MENVDLRFVRLVSRHYANMQGLYLVAIGPLIPLLPLSVWSFDNGVVRLLYLLTGLVLFPAILFLTLARVRRFYAEGFGRFVTRRRPWLSALGFCALAAQDRLQHLLPATTPDLVWLAAAGFALWIVVDSWPYRWYHLATVAVLVWLASERHSGLMHTPFLALLTLCFTLIVTGLADHALLMRAAAPSGAPAAAANRP